MCKGVLACKLQKEHSGVYLFHICFLFSNKKKFIEKKCRQYVAKHGSI